jgi:class 3 adenylate cyclase
VVFADLSGYTRVTDEQGDEIAVRISASLQSRAEAVAAGKGGRLVKLLGDGAMLYFPEPLRGAEAALELVRNLSADLGLPARAGVHAGPVIERDRDLFGRTVNLASRLAGAAGPGDVIVSEAIVRSAPDDRLHFEPMGNATLKGFAEPVPLFRLRPSSRS